MRKTVLLLGSFTLLALTACEASDTPPACAAAASRLAACELAIPADFSETCSAAGAEETAAAYDQLSCEELAQILAAGGKADGPILDRQLGQGCFFNFQCAGDLVCGPYETATDWQCRPRSNDHLCNDDRDCLDGWECLACSGGGYVCYEEGEW